MIDTHCHLDRVPDPEAAMDNDLRAMVTIGTDADRSEGAVRTACEHPRVFAAVGVHPNDAPLADDADVRARIEALSSHPRVVAIGETGFDAHWQDTTLDVQRRAFDWHAALAGRSDRPLILHVRDAQGADDASRAAEAAIRDAGHPRGVLHCFGGDPTLMATALDLGWMVSFAGNLTFKNAADLRERAREVPRERLLVETDAPFLAPEPKRGRRNVPAWVAYTARTLAEARGEDPDALASLLDDNAIRFYRLPL